MIIVGGEDGIRTHVPDFSDHPISSRRRYGHFGTSPAEARLYAGHRQDARKVLEPIAPVVQG